MDSSFLFGFILYLFNKEMHIALTDRRAPTTISIRSNKTVRYFKETPTSIVRYRIHWK